MKKPEFREVILSIVIISMFFYSWYIYIYENEDFVSWLNTLISTLISVSLALIIAIYILNYQTKLVENETKDKFIPLIENFLISIWKGLADLSSPMKYQFSNGEKVFIHLIYFQNIIFEQAIISNVFNKAQTDFLLNMYTSVHYNNIVMEQVINMNHLFVENPDSYKKYIKNCQINNKLSRERLKKIIKLANKSFKFNKLDNEMKNAKKR